MTEQPLDLPHEEKQAALQKILERTLALPARVTLYVSALGAVALMGGNVDPATLPPALGMLVGSVGVNVLSDIIDRVARGQSDDEHLTKAIEEAIAVSNIGAAFDNSDFQRGLGQILREQRHLYYALRHENETIANRLVEQFQAFPALVDELGGEIIDELRQIRHEIGDIKSHIEQQSSQATDRVNVLIERTLISQIDQQSELISGLTARVSEFSKQRLKEMRIAWQEGQQENVIASLKELREDPDQWHSLSLKDKAELLCFAASLEFEQNNIDLAKQLLDEAGSHAEIEHEARLRALIAYRESGPDDALTILQDLRDVPSLNLKAIILLEVGRIAEAKNFLPDLNSQDDYRTETRRVRSLFYLVERDVKQARSEIQAALMSAPRWRSVRFTAAVIDYYSALSSIALPPYLAPFPEPIGWEVIKQDSNSLMNLQTASNVFSELAEGSSGAERLRLCIWRLASLANNRKQHQIASQYCRELLAEDPTQPVVIVWAIVRGLDINFSECEQALNQLVANEQASVHHVLALMECLRISGKFHQIIALLQSQELKFSQSHMGDTWLYHYTTALLRLGDFDKAKTLLAASNITQNTKTHLQGIFLEADAKRTGNWNELLQFLHEQYSITDDPTFLISAYNIKHQLGDWEGVLVDANILIERVTVDDIFHKAINAAYQSRQAEQCLDLIDKYKTFLDQEVLSEDIRRMKADCYFRIGAFKEAYTEAQMLKENNNTVANLLLFAEVASKTGALHILHMLASEIADWKDIDALPRLSTARIIGGKDLEKARHLWRQAQKNLSDEDLLNALMVAHALGIKEETGHIFERLQPIPPQLADQIQLVPTEEMLSISQKVNEENSVLQEKYNAGTWPIHRIISHLHVTLAELYHLFLAKNEANSIPFQQFALFARHGGRPEIQGLASEGLRGQLHLDITALLLAAHLELLDMIEAQFAPLIIPAELIPLLVEIYCRLEERDLAQLQACQQIVDLVNEGRLVVETLDWERQVDPDLTAQLGLEWTVQFEAARENSAYFVNFLPLRKRGLTQEQSVVSNNVAEKLLDIRSILDVLYQPYGLLTHEQYQQKIQVLGSLSPRIAPRSPRRDDILYFFANTLEALAEAGLLKSATQLFKVHITQHQLDEARKFISHDTEIKNLATWVYDLIGRLHRGVMDEKYLVLPFYEAGDVRPIIETPPNLVTSSLVSLLKIVESKNKLVWADDRYVNSLLSHNGSWVLSITDILHVLLNEGRLKEDAYYQYLRRLRAANVRFLPLTSKEILHHLMLAPIEKSSVDETIGLKTLRQYIAACMSWNNVLQVPPLEENALNKEGEVLFVNQLYQAVIETLFSIWQVTQDVEEALIRCEWVLNYLYLDYAALLQNVKTKAWIALFKGLLLSGAGLENRPIRDCPSTLRQSFFSWLWVRILEPRVMAEPDIMPEIVAELKLYLSQLQQSGIEGVPNDQVLLLSHRFLADIPSAIREAIFQDEEFLNQTNIDFILTFDDVRIARKPLLEAAEMAINGATVTIKPLKSEVEIELIPVEVESGQIIIQIVESETMTLLGELPPTFHMLCFDESVCRELLLQNSSSFDLPHTVFEKFVEKVVRLEPQRRLREVENALENSAIIFYKQLHDRLTNEQPVLFEKLLLPEIDNLLRFLRFERENEVGFTESLEQAANILIKQNDPWEALWRLSCLPVPLPNTLLVVIRDLSPTEREKLIERFSRAAISPIAKIHLLYLLNIFGSNPERPNELATWLASDNGISYYSAFSAVLRWVANEFERRIDAYHLPVSFGLAVMWLHATQIFSISISASREKQIDLESFATQFAPSKPRPLLRFFEGDGYSLDIACPGQVGYLTFLLAGLAYARQGMAFSTRETNLKERILALLQRESPVMWELSRPARRIISGAPNSMNSFLGKETYSLIPTLLGESDHEEWPTSPLETTREILDIVEKQNLPENWLQLHVLLGDWPISEEFRERFVSVALKTDFTPVLRENPSSSYVALLTVITQLRYVKNQELVTYMRQQIIQIAQSLSVIHQRVMRQTDSEEIPHSEILVNVIARFARVHSLEVAGVSAVSNYVELIREVVTNCPYLRYDALQFSQQLYDELPISEARQLMSLLLWLRAN